MQVLGRYSGASQHKPNLIKYNQFTAQAGCLRSIWRDMGPEHTPGLLYADGHRLLSDTMPRRTWGDKQQFSGAYIVGQLGLYSSPDMPTSEANARRLVACWNACDGISTDSMIENGVIGYELAAGLVKERDTLAADNARLRQQVIGLTEQRAALAAKLAELEKQEPVGCGYVVKYEKGNTPSTYETGWIQVMGVNVYLAAGALAKVWQSEVDCEDCGGQGYTADVTSDGTFKDHCDTCNGRGTVATPQPAPAAQQVNRVLLEALKWITEYVESVPADLPQAKKWAKIAHAVIVAAEAQGKESAASLPCDAGNVTQQVGINGLTEAETNASMSVRGLSKPTQLPPNLEAYKDSVEYAGKKWFAAQPLELSPEEMEAAVKLSNNEWLLEKHPVSVINVATAILAAANAKRGAS